MSPNKPLSIYDIETLKNTTELEREIFDSILQRIAVLSGACVDFYQNFMSNNTYLNNDFIVSVPYKNGCEFVIHHSFSTIKIIKTFPVCEEVEKVDITTCDFSLDYSAFSDSYDSYPERESKKSLLTKLSSNDYLSTEYVCQFRLQLIDGAVCDREIYSANIKKHNLIKPMFVEFLEAIGEEKLAENLREYRSSYLLESIDLKEISVALEQIETITDREKLKCWVDFNFNDCDNSVYLFDKKGDYSCIYLSEQNAKFVVLFKNKSDYIVYQVGSDLSLDQDLIELDEDKIQSVHSHYFHDICTLFTNSNSYDFRISKEFVEQSSLEDILSKECYLLRVNGKEIILKDGLIDNFVRDVEYSQYALVDEYNDELAVVNKYNGSPQMLYADSISRYPTLYRDKKGLRYYLLLCNGNNYSWNNKGFLVNNNEKLSLSEEEANKIHINEGEVLEFHRVDTDSNLFTFPDNISSEWLDEIKSTILDLAACARVNEEAYDSLYFVIDNLQDKECLKSFVNSIPFD